MGDSFSPSISSLSLSSGDPFTNSQDSGARNILSDDEVETPRWLQDVSQAIVYLLISSLDCPIVEINKMKKTCLLVIDKKLDVTILTSLGL